MVADTNPPKRSNSISDVPKTRKRSRTGGSKDLYEGHSQDVMMAKTLIDPDHQCSVTTVKAYVTHVCAWFRYCRTLPEPNYTLVNEEKLSGFLKWATQTPRLPCKSGSGGSMSYQSARRYVEGGILALWRRYKMPDEENPLHALSYLSTKYAIREATSSSTPKSAPEKHFTAMPVSQDQEETIVRTLLSPERGRTTVWAPPPGFPGARRLHLRLDALHMSQRTDARLVEHTTIPFMEFRVNPDPTTPTGRFAEVTMARHTNPLVCPWYAVAMLVFSQWQAQPSAMAAASLYDSTTWLSQPLFLASTADSLVFLADDARVKMVQDELAPILAHATGNGRGYGRMMAEALGLNGVVHHRRTGVTRAQTFFDLTLPPAHTDTPHAFRAPSRTRLQVPDHLVTQVFPWLCDWLSQLPSPPTQGGRQRSYSMSAQNSDDVARAERSASIRMMRELAVVLLMSDPQYAPILDAHPIFQAPVFHSRAFRDFANYAAQALSLRHSDVYAPPPPLLVSPVPQPMTPALASPVHSGPTLLTQPFPTLSAPPSARRRGMTFETIQEDAEPPMSAFPSIPMSAHHHILPPTMPTFNPMLLSQPLAFPPLITTPTQPVAFPQLMEEQPQQQHQHQHHQHHQHQPPVDDPTQQYSQQDLFQLIDYLSTCQSPPQVFPMTQNSAPLPAAAYKQDARPKVTSQQMYFNQQPGSSSPTPTPGSDSPGLTAADSLQFSIAPYKLQLKSDTDLFLQ
ncbi:hypothetical protein DL89DRAFT_268695 [Linderina pennispora]|uniref:Ndc10 domain-containing protein n=1 Tax=Linderina pennispora TaxID=61395 RepID=A0A1Y1W3N0_9FUNG|nr:uncharacterized protein DL89DRAFT_268695 [Linderina pennispora]ORX68159.1 hypothetical protein DL89DRAFT_268695 [Linderina pennispora]